MNTEVVFRRTNGWLPTVIRAGENLRLEFAGGADALHDPRTFSVPIEESHLAALRADLARHLILWSAMLPLGSAAGIDGPLDEVAAVALLDPILLARPDEVDEFLRHTRWDAPLLVAYGASIDAIRSGRVVDSMSAATESSDWRRAQEFEACLRRARLGVTLSSLDAALLKFTGQYRHWSAIPRRDPRAADPALLPEVRRVIATAERACSDMSTARDPRRGGLGTDQVDRSRMKAAVDAAVRGAHPELADEAVEAVSFLVCSEAVERARTPLP